MRRRGDAKAIVAVGHEILLAAYRILVTAQPYTDPGPTTLSRLTTKRLTRQAVRRLQDLGYQVTIAPRTDAA
jgi:transposase